MNKYPLWRYILMVVLIVLGLVYALPNLYIEDPAVQVTPQMGKQFSSTEIPDMEAFLKQQDIDFLSIKKEKDSIWARFKDTTTQLKAQDFIKAKLGEGFSVAVTLAPRTPKWLQAIGANPMKLGLDLRGGIHFLLQVDVDAAIKERQQGATQSMAEMMRGANIRYAGISSGQVGPQKTQAITIGFRKSDDLQQAQSLLSSKFSDYTFSKDAGNPLALNATFSLTAVTNIRSEIMQQNITTLTKRVNALGVSEATVQQQGLNQISVDLPGIQDVTRAMDLIGKVANLRFQLVDAQNDANLAAQTGNIPAGDQLYYYQGRPTLLKSQVILHGESIVGATSLTGQDGRPSVNVTLGSGESMFHRITGQNIGKPLAVVYVETKSVSKMVNGKKVTTRHQIENVISVATIQAALPGTFSITGLESPRYAQDLALQLRSGAYPVPVEIVQNLLVGPSLGKENIDKGVDSTAIGSLLVLIFMLFYYRLFGLVANMALVLNIVFIVAILSLLGATLTLPGIAGIVLTVGMAVDANVLINERIREELRNGVSVQASIRAGYDRAFSTIVDANVTTLIVAVVLLALSTTTVKSFAINLIIGLLTSMVTAIFMTRAVINLIYGSRQKVKHLSIGIKVKK